MPSTNGWTKSIERLLKNWSQQISINEDEYRKRGTFYRAWYYAFGVFSVIAQTGALTTLINVIVSIINTPDKCKPSNVNLGLLVFIAIMETLILIAQGLDKFFNFGSGSEQFYEAAKDHNALSRLIDATLTLPRIDRDSAREVLLSVRQQFNHIQDNSPNLPPNAIVHRLDMYIYENPSQAKGQCDRVTQVDNMEEDIDGSPPVPEDAVAVDLPESPSEDLSHDPDEEHVSIAQQCKFGAQIQEQKGAATREHHRKRALRILEYQWRRMEQHAEEERQNSTAPSPQHAEEQYSTDISSQHAEEQYSTDTSSQNPEDMV